MNLISTTLGNLSGEDIPFFAIAGGVLVAIVAIGGGHIRSVLNTKAREQSRREISAYVAEGSITPTDAERLIAAGTKADDKCCG